MTKRAKPQPKKPIMARFGDLQNKFNNLANYTQNLEAHIQKLGRVMVARIIMGGVVGLILGTIIGALGAIAYDR